MFSPAAVDQIAWGCSVPAKAGLYHAFTRTNANATREHKVYIIVSGCLTHAAEEWYNLWLDSGKHATCGELLECEELEWLRTATHRSHNRIAADLSSLFGVRLRIVLDTKNPVPNTLMAMQTTTTYMNDIRVAVFEWRGISAMERVDTRYAMHKLTALEADAALNAMQHSPHARLRVSCCSGNCCVCTRAN